MTTVATPLQRPTADPLPRLLTVADLAELPSELPSGPVDYELDNGRIVVMAPPGDMHGASQSNVGTELKIQGERRGHGKARTDVGVVLWRNPDRVVSPDALFIANRSLPIRRSPEGYLETIPDLIVEVRSKNDTPTYIQQKIDDYFRAGVSVVWVADPQSRTLSVYRPSAAPQVLTADQQLTVEDIIPGFAANVGELLRD
jgi:Uma2 family endonuclease